MGPSAKTVIEQNLARLQKAHRARSINAFAKMLQVEQSTLDRIMKGKMSPTLERIEHIARKLGLEAWQLLMPGLDPDNPPVFVMTDAERDLYKRLAEAAGDIAKAPHAYNND